MVPYPEKVKSLNTVWIVWESHIVAIWPAENSRPMVQQRQSTDRCKCSVYVERHTSLNLSWVNFGGGHTVWAL